MQPRAATAELPWALRAGNGLANQAWTLQKPGDMPIYCDPGAQPPELCPGSKACPACGRAVCPCPSA